MRSCESKVLMLTPSYEPIVGGTETAVRDLVSRLNFLGIRSDVMTFNMNRKWRPVWKWDVRQEYGHILHRIPAINPFGMSGLMSKFLGISLLPDPFFLRRLGEYRLLHCHDVVDLTFPLLSSLSRIPRILHCHTLNERFEFYNKNGFLRKLLGRAADVYIAVSTSGCGLLSRLGIAPERIRLLHNGVDTDVFVPGKSRSDDIILFVGRWEERKGIPVLLESLDYLERPSTLVLIGPSVGGEYYRSVRDLLERQSRKHKIVYLGSLERQELVKWLQRASLLVCPSLAESFGIVCIEAMACGTPVVASDIDGIRDIISNRETGILVPSCNSKQLAAAIQYLMDNPVTRRRLGERGRVVVERKFSLAAVTMQLLNIYEDVLKSNDL